MIRLGLDLAFAGVKNIPATFDKEHSQDHILEIWRQSAAYSTGS